MALPADLIQISDTIWELPTSHKPGMRVPARIYATKALMQTMNDGVFEQVTNVATLPGIVRAAYCMPDGHWGYGFPIGGVAAMDAATGVISPGGIGFDINCGMRLVVTNLTYAEVKPRLAELVDALYKRVPAGVGSTGFVRLSHATFCEAVTTGARWCVQHGYGWPEDLERKDAQRLLLRVQTVVIHHERAGFALQACAAGEPINPVKHALGADVKGVTLHRLQIIPTPAGWEATVVLDV